MRVVMDYAAQVIIQAAVAVVRARRVEIIAPAEQMEVRVV
jgi:hypothetical protein